MIRDIKSAFYAILIWRGIEVPIGRKVSNPTGRRPYATRRRPAPTLAPSPGRKSALGILPAG